MVYLYPYRGCFRCEMTPIVPMTSTMASTPKRKTFNDVNTTSIIYVKIMYLI
jgi:hypothetical protein